MRRILGVVALAAVVLGACGNDDDPTMSGSGAATSGEMAGDGGAMSAMCSPSGSTVSVVAAGTAFDKGCLAVPAGQPFKLTMENKDGVGHNIAILAGHDSAEVLFRADIFAGPRSTTFDVPALKAGTYVFHCEVHPGQMRGSFVVA